MRSKWFHLKEPARNMRMGGSSLGDIETALGINRSTLSGWFQDIKLSKKQKAEIRTKWLKSLRDARLKAARWHNEQKDARLKLAEKEAQETLTALETSNPHVIELALAILYLGEGSKRNIETAIGNSDPMILRFFIVALQKIYNFDKNRIKCELHLRADQNPEKMKRYWAKALQMPLKNFGWVSIDPRTKGKKTYDHYHGVCLLRCSSVAIQRKLVYLSKMFCEKVIAGA